MRTAVSRRTEARALDRTRSLAAGALIGVGIMAAVDTVVFHQVLGWHHFYDRSTPAIGLLSDGLLQAVYLAMLVGGLFLFSELRGRATLERRSVVAGTFLGLGGFQLFDGLVNHKVLRVHQIRYGVESLLPYDLVWNLAAVVLLAIGAALVWGTRRRGPETAGPGVG